MVENSLATRLTDLGYTALLSEYPDRLQVESIKREPDIAIRLLGIVNNRNIAWQARFMASEFLFRHVDMTLHSQYDRAGLQGSYFQALHHDYTGNGIDWGFGKDANDLGVLGRMVIRIGGDLQAFRLGLDDGQPVTMIFFWRTPFHYCPPYRVKDFAALIIAKANGWTMDLAGSPNDRDRAIAKLKQMNG
jgi:hypothetical protein